MKKTNAPGTLVFMASLALFALTACTHIPSEKPPLPNSQPKLQQDPLPNPPKEEAAAFDPKHFVEDMLVSKGHKRAYVRTLLSDPRVTVNTAIMTKNVFDSAPQPSAKNPKVMEVSPKFYKKGIEFIAEYEDAFETAWERYQVSPEVITAILILETRLGDYPMKYNVFRVYTSLTTLLDSEYFTSVLQTVRSGYVPTEKVINDARKKGKWGLEELSALISLSERLGIDPISINGSFAGALGPAQFIPTSFVRFGVDGNDDGKVDPFDMEDCIVSVANYLKLAGWKEDAAIKNKRQAIWAYNHHEVYVNTIMMIYDRLITEHARYNDEKGGETEDALVPASNQKTPGQGKSAAGNGRAGGAEQGPDAKGQPGGKVDTPVNPAPAPSGGSM
ncbi:MAG TPA: lytic murein transglycosylase [Deltaproteobacteria bacterium]|nr:lytic murein transglycosylase [Deltaproteobacteria bacterium]HQI01939.1 lytic murein transglycosylase [Deltaproteobacteria bacterium]HQJ08514.1 lytic murein transglycosylase [Deltaproteobacteria bacterium]